MIGQTISQYKIVEKLGEGGMGVVYKAHDTKLDRFVALKFLPAHLNASVQDKARFTQEAKAAAALNHPNVCSIIDIQEHDDKMFIVMEFVDGQTLRGKQASMSFKQAIDIGIQIADGLAAAHEKGIIHRDIKPENIMIRKDGIAQIMDFGLAKLRANGSKITRLTKQGSTVGTAGYMSPEQVQGHDTDHRSDIFSFGVMFYEMLTGQLPFRGVHETALMYEIVNVDPAPMNVVNREIDPNLDAIVLECLEKDVNERAQSIKQIAVDLKRYKRESSRQRASRITAAQPVYAPSGPVPAQPDVPSEKAMVQKKAKNGRLPWIISGVLLLIAVGTVVFYFLRQPLPADRQVTRALILSPNKTNFNMQVGGHLALSPDGLTVAFVATDTTGTDRVWIRPISSLTALPLTGTEGATYPFWSFDNQTIAFFTNGTLKKIDAKGGPPLTICEAPSGRGGTWNQDGIVVFAANATGSLSKVSAAGGKPEELTKLDTINGTQSHRWPFFLPDGLHFLYTTQSSSASANENDVIRIASLDRSVDTVLMHGSSNVAYASGYLLFIRQTTLMAQPFDPAKASFTSDAVPIVEQIQYAAVRSRGMFSISRNGVLVFQTGDPQEQQLAVFNRSGTRTILLGERGATWSRFSPDGKAIAFARLDPQLRNSDLWIRDIVRGTDARFTFESVSEVSPRWSPNSDVIVFSSNRKGRMDLYLKKSNGTGEEDRLFESKLDKYTFDWSRDGKFLSVTTVGDPKTKADLWLLPLFGDKKPIAFLHSEFNEGRGRFSPDTRWIAYQSDETGRNEIYVRLTDGSGGKWQVSTTGGVTPFWLAGGREIIYSSNDRKLMGAKVNGAGATFVVDSIHTLFDYESRGIVGSSIEDVSPDGNGFLAQVTELRQASPPITLVVNWDEELKKK
jgi:eukaryotic-like serine/threonine-protein kinase